MKFIPLAVLSLLAAGPVLADESAGTPDPSIIPPAVAAKAIALRDRALHDNLPVDIVESVTTEVGARRMGTEGDRRVIAWAQAKFRELGFDRVWTEPVELDRGWDRGEAHAEVLAPFAHDIVLTALGYSVGTDGDLIGEIVEFPTYDDLLAVPEGDSLDGKIAFVSYSMPDYVNPEDGSNRGAYGEGTRARGKGRVEAAKRGAEALIIRLVRGEEQPAKQEGSTEPIAQDVVFAAREAIHAVTLGEAVEKYIVDLVFATRYPDRYSEPLASWIHVGVSPRGGIALDKCARTVAWLEGRDHVLPEDVRAVVHGIFRHRLKLSYDASADGVSANDVIDEILKVVAVA